MTRTLVLMALVSGLGAAPQTGAAKPPASTTATAAQTTPSSARYGSIDLTVTSQSGAFLADAHVRAEGPTSRQGSTGADGETVLANVTAGTYRCRIQRDGYVTLEKELVVKTGARTTAEAVLSPAMPSAAPAPAPASCPAPAPVSTTSSNLVAGLPVTVSLVDQLADQLLKSKDAVAEHVIGCSGDTEAKLIRLTGGLESQTHANADVMLYMIAGDATLTMNGKDSNIGPGWFGLVPRGTTHTINRRGNKPLLVLSIESGQACSNNGAPGAK